MKKYYSLTFICIITLVFFMGCSSNESMSNESTPNSNISNGSIPYESTSNIDISKESTPSESTPSETTTEANIGIMSSFEAEGIDGNFYDQSILKDKKISMITVWSTTCAPCLGELPDLAILHEKYADRGFQVVGICLNTIDIYKKVIPNKVKEANKIVSSTEANFIHLIPSPSLNETILDDVQAVPMTVFVDSEGNMISEIYYGADGLDIWEPIILSLLEKVN